MSLSIASLGSGSNGNATLVRVDDTLLLVDAGFSAKELGRRLERLGVYPEQISALLISHEHSDHVKGLAVLARKFRMPVWLTCGTYRRLRDTNFNNAEMLNPHASLRIGDARVSVFPVPHDAAEPCQYVIGDGRRRFAIATDMGCVTPHVLSQLSGVDGLLIEANYDGVQLQNGPYPKALRVRIAGQYGHLSNDQAATLVQSLDHPGMQHLLLGHLSENNNTPEDARRTVINLLARDSHRVNVLKRHCESAWFSLD